jgi:hypothetical protein
MSLERTVDVYERDEAQSSWLVRGLMRAEAWARPWLGWGVLLTCMALAILPAVAVRANRWLDLGNLQRALELSGPLAVLSVWLLWGWRSPRQSAGEVWRLLGLALIGPIVISQLVLGWIPGPAAWTRAILEGRWVELAGGSVAVWLQAGARAQLWWEGVQAGGAAQDNLVFAAVGSLLLWLTGGLCGRLAQRMRQGYVAAIPPLWLLGMMLLYSQEGRYLMVSGLALTITLHLFLDHRVLVERWRHYGLDFSPGLLTDRLLTVTGAAVLILTVAGVMPNLYLSGMVNSYYALLAPINARVEALGDRLFPDVRGTSRLRGGAGNGLPNEFLLQGGPDLGSAVVLRVRTDESPVGQSYEFPFDEMVAPPGHYMRGATYAFYDGRGWSNVAGSSVRQVPENVRWNDDALWGRKIVVQSVIMEVSTPLLLAAPEPIEASVAVRLEERSAGDQMRLNAREQSYAVVSAVPAVSEEMLRTLPAVSMPLAEELVSHLQLPEQITLRTRELADELTAGQATDYDKALAIERYLRQFTYDLEVDAPPPDVVDVADYFLFELQRGYCDYYATAFVVLARLAGLPTRFASGYAVGQWNPVEGVWVVSEAEAHSWPEVYFPQIGWVAFEPTAGRPELTRIASPDFSQPLVVPEVVPTEAVVDRPQADPNWQVLVWLIPAGLVVWGMVWGVARWRQRREDPWTTLVAWGGRAGRPMGEGETVLEYGRGLAQHVLARSATVQDTSRVVAREIEAVSMEVNVVQYAPEDVRPAASAAVGERWVRLRGYLRVMRLR